MIENFEVNFTNAISNAVDWAPERRLDARLVSELLLPAVQRLERSSTPQPHLAKMAFRAMDALRSGAAARSDARGGVPPPAPPPAGLHTCALPSCGVREARPSHFKSCGACRAAYYCSREHQAADWKAHRESRVCKAARKAAKPKHKAGPSNA